jgi:uncharacterized protein YjiS (DUF1127 family)
MKATAMPRIFTLRSAMLASRTRPHPRLWSRLLSLNALFRQRHTLARLDDHMLRDIGLTPEQAQSEATRPFWDVPSHWRG